VYQGIRRRNNGGKGSFSQYEIYYNGDMKSRIWGGDLSHTGGTTLSDRHGLRQVHRKHN
jgi:hypothetical protein